MYYWLDSPHKTMTFKNIPEIKKKLEHIKEKCNLLCRICLLPVYRLINTNSFNLTHASLD